MDGLSGAASVIAVIDITAKIALLCFQYTMAVKDAKNNVKRIKKKVGDVKRVLEGVKKLLDGPHKARLSTTHHLFMSLEQCLRELGGLKSELESGKAMSRFGVRALKWPFTGKQVEKIVSSLGAHKHTFTLALQINQT
jgi:hypothetical protein